jgi:glycosyltransferase involved in cell wall biosynthesis
MVILKLCVFPNDPIKAYFDKGEIKERYFNPENLFDEIEVISFTNNDIDGKKVSIIGGNAKLKIHSIGKINFKNKNKKKQEATSLLKKIKPDIIRAYNPLLEGWIAASCSKELNIPMYLSLHVQYDGLRKISKTKNLKKYIGLQLTRKFIEPFVLKNSQKITAVYKIIDHYAYDICGKHVDVIYNKVELERFQKGEKILDYEKPLILTVGRLVKQKNHDLIINAIKDLDVYLMIIGNGKLKEELVELIKKLNIKEKIIFKDSVANNEIQNYYKSCDILISAHDPEIEGVPIPILEGLASGIPVISSKPKEGYSDGLENIVEFSELTALSLKKAIEKILSDQEINKKLRNNALKKANDFSSSKIEKQEADVYRELLGIK